MPGRPFIMSGAPWRVARPAPRLGQHTAEALADLGYTSEQVQSFRRAGVL